MPEQTLAELLSPSALARIENYAVLARTVVEGFISGMHRSVYHGFGSEFLQYRNYSPGDDLKYVDWKVFARSDRHVTKVFQEETNLNCCLVLDTSASMAYQGQAAACSKLHYAAMVAACLAYLANRQGDNVGLYCYGDTLTTALPPVQRQGHLHRLLTELARLTSAGSSRHEQYLPHIAQSLRRRGVVVFLSDFLEADETVLPLLRRFRSAQHDCIAMQIVDADELDLPFERTTRFIDSESGAELVTAPQNIRNDYRTAMEAFLDRLRKGCLEIGIDHVLVNTSEDLGGTLAAYLHRRGSVY